MPPSPPPNFLPAALRWCVCEERLRPGACDCHPTHTRQYPPRDGKKMLGPLVAIAVLTGEPECVASFKYCYPQRASVGFDGTYRSLFYYGHARSEWSSRLGHLCSKENWMRRDECFSHCPLQLVVTHPPEYRFAACIQDNAFEPYAPSAHLDLHHPLNGKELRIVTPPKDVRAGCNVNDFEGSGGTSYYNNTLVMINRGACLFTNKFANAKAVGAVAGIMVNVAPLSMYSQYMVMIGDSSSTHDMMSGLFPSQFGEPILEALDKGLEVRGKLVYSCEPTPLPPLLPAAMQAYTSCPHPGLVGECAWTEDPLSQLCNRCPLQLKYNGLSACLWGNDLLPRKAENLWGERHRVPSVGVLAAFAESLPNDGCKEGDFSGLSGEIVLVREPGKCRPYTLVRAAQAAGVAAVVVLGSVGDSRASPVEGLSTFVYLPVHTVVPSDVPVVNALFLQAGVPQQVSGARFHHRRVDIVEGYDLPVKLLTTPAPAVTAVQTVVETTGELEWTPFISISVALIVVLIACMVARYIKRRRAANECQTLEELVDDRDITLPLAAAQTVLTLVLLMCVAVAAFLLAFRAGTRATDSALNDGQAALRTTYDNAANNVDDLSKQLRGAIITSVEGRIEGFLSEGERMAEATAALYFQYDGTWASFRGQYPVLVEFWHKSTSSFSWYLRAFTTEGFYGSGKRLTDEHDDATRADGQAHVSVTNNGFLYGLEKHWYNDAERANVPYTREAPTKDDPQYRLGGIRGDPYKLMAGTLVREKRWLVSPVWEPSMDYYDEVQKHFISVFSPIYQGNTYKGFVQIDTHLLRVVNLVQDIIAIDPARENMTALIIDKSFGSNLLVGTNVYFPTRPSYMRFLYASPFPGTKMYRVVDCPPVQVVAAGRFLESPECSQSSCQFEQKKWYQDASDGWLVLHIAVHDGVAVSDNGPENYHLELMGDCHALPGGCVAHDGDTGEAVLRFDGSSILQVYRNLTLSSQSAQEALAAGWSLIDYGGSEPCIAADGIVPGLPTVCLLKPPGMFGDVDTTVEVRFKPDEAVSPSDLAQTLFSDSERGESYLKILASGRLIIGVSTYVCRTKPLLKALEPGRWHTLTATVNRWESTCSMYVDGVLHDVADKTQYDRLPDLHSLAVPWVAGRAFRGSIASIKGYRVHLSAEEVGILYRERRLVRQVPRREWFMERSRILRNSSRVQGIDWEVVAMLPRIDVMRIVDGNNRMVLANAQTQEANTNSRRRQETYEALFCLVVIALADVLIFQFFNALITEPIEAMAVTLHDAAYLKVQEIPESRNRITEVAVMTRATALMVKNLTTYQSFLPLHVKEEARNMLVAETDDDISMRNDAMDDCATIQNSHDSDNSHSNKSSKDGGSINRGGFSASSRVFHTLRPAFAGLGDTMDRLVRREVSCIVSNLCGFNALEDHIGTHGHVLTAFLKAATEARGAADFVGDKFYCHFNMIKLQLDHKRRALDLACALKTQWKGGPCAVNSAAATGVVLSGRLGNVDLCKLSVVGDLPRLLAILERVGRLEHLDIVATQALREYTLLHVCRVHGFASCPSLSGGTPFEVSEVEAACEKPQEAEWMYQLAGHVDPYRDWNSLCGRVLRGDWEVCFRFLVVFCLVFFCWFCCVGVTFAHARTHSLPQDCCRKGRSRWQKPSTRACSRWFPQPSTGEGRQRPFSQRCTATVRPTCTAWRSG